MTLISQRVIEQHLGPIKINENNVMYWSTHLQELIGDFKNKAMNFMKYDCIRYVGKDNEYKKKCSFICLPLNQDTEVTDKKTGRVFTKEPFTTFYSKTIKTLYRKDGRWVCNCQGWRSSEKGKSDQPSREDGCQCSHTLALFLAFKIRRFQEDFDYE